MRAGGGGGGRAWGMRIIFSDYGVPKQEALNGVGS